MENQGRMYRKGAVGGILDEYERALRELRAVIEDVTSEELTRVVDETTEDPNCKSIQTILAHVVRSGYTYAILINSLKGQKEAFRERVYHTTASAFVADLDEMFAFNVLSLSQFDDAELEEYDTSKKALSSWGQTYDAEQMMEHAIVHILRHRR
jgi:hypothetical protein